MTVIRLKWEKPGNCELGTLSSRSRIGNWGYPCEVDAVKRQKWRSLRTAHNPLPASRCASTKLCRHCGVSATTQTNNNALFYGSAMCELLAVWGEHSTNRRTQADSRDCDLFSSSRKLPRERVTLQSRMSRLSTRCNDEVCAVYIGALAMRSGSEPCLSAHRYTKRQQMSQAAHIEPSGRAEKR